MKLCKYEYKKYSQNLENKDVQTRDLQSLLNDDDTNKAATVVKNYLEIRLLFMKTIQSLI